MADFCVAGYGMGPFAVEAYEGGGGPCSGAGAGSGEGEFCFESGSQYVDLPGTAGNYISTPDSAAVSVLGDIDVRLKMAVADWTPPFFSALFAQYGSAGTRSWSLDFSSGAPGVSVSTDGTTELFSGSGGLSFADGSTQWLRFTRVVATGVSTIYWSTDGVTWTLHSASGAQNPGVALFNSAAAVTIGARNGGSSASDVNIYYAEVRNGIDGPVVASFNADSAVITGPQTPNTVVGGGGETWTINGAGWVWGESTEICVPVTGGEEGGTPGPTSSVRNIDETGGRLGCGEPTAFITARCGEGVACILENMTQLQWDRRLDDISEATVTMTLSGDSKATCCLCLADVEPWCHELHIWRDGEEVWVGPVVEIMYSYSKVTIRARDALAWLTVRVPSININFTPAESDFTTIGEFIINTAFALDTVTCEVDNMHTTLTGETTQFFRDKFSSDALSMLEDLADIGLDFTTLGRTIVLVGDAAPLTPLILLNDEHIIGEVEISKHGELQENVAYVHFDGDLGTPALSDPVPQYCYGDIERLHDGAGIPDGVSAGNAADTYVESAGIAPRIMEVPPGSRLSPDTPWTIDQMVCGARVDVAILKTCFTLTQSFRLTQVEVIYTPATQEQVNITLSPINSLA